MLLNPYQQVYDCIEQMLGTKNSPVSSPAPATTATPPTPQRVFNVGERVNVYQLPEHTIGNNPRAYVVSYGATIECLAGEDHFWISEPVYGIGIGGMGMKNGRRQWRVAASRLEPAK